jgi:DNA end-binding protein Ku
MLELAQHIVKSKAGHFHPEKFEDQYEDALKELLKKKQAGEKIEAPPSPRQPRSSISWMRYEQACKPSVEVARGGRPNPEHQQDIEPQRRRPVRVRVSGRARARLPVKTRARARAHTEALGDSNKVAHSTKTPL